MSAYDIFFVKIVDFFGCFRQLEEVFKEKIKRCRAFHIGTKRATLTMMKRLKFTEKRAIAAIVSLGITGLAFGGVPGAGGGIPGIPGAGGGIPGIPGAGGGIPGIPGAGNPTPLPAGQQSVTPPIVQRPGWTPEMGPMSPSLALKLLMGNGFTARPYYNGVPDLAAGKGVKRTRTRDLIKRKLRSIVVPYIDPLHSMTMKETIDRLATLFRESDPSSQGFNLAVNPFIDPGGAAIAPTSGGGGGAGSGGSGGAGMGIDPITGLPTGGAGGGMSGGLAPGIDPVTGLPTGGAPTGLGEPGVAGGLPGMGAGGLPGMGAGAQSTAMKPTFDPEVVKINGLGSPMVNMTAKQILDIVTMSFDHPIQYVVLDQGIVFFQQDPKFAGYVTHTLQLNLNQRSLGQLGIQTPQLGGGQNGGGQNGGGQNGGGQNGGGYPGGSSGGYPGGPGGGDPSLEPGMGEIEKINRFRPFNSMGGYQRLNSFTSGYGPSRARERR